jgi:NAD(P)H-dependent FMN reductase
VHLLATSVTPSRSSTRLGLHVAGLLGQAGIEVTVTDMGEAPERWFAHPGAHLAHYPSAFLELAAEIAGADALIVAASVYSQLPSGMQVVQILADRNAGVLGGKTVWVIGCAGSAEGAARLEILAELLRTNGADVWSPPLGSVPGRTCPEAIETRVAELSRLLWWDFASASVLV